MPSSVHPAQGVWDSKSPPFIGSIPILLLSGKNVIFFSFSVMNWHWVLAVGSSFSY